MNQNKLWSDTKTQKELRDIARDRKNKSLCMFVEYSENTQSWDFCPNTCEHWVCGKHEHILDNQMDKYKEFLSQPFEDTIAYLRNLESNEGLYDLPRYWRHRDQCHEKIYRATALQLARVYIRDIVEVYRENDPDEFYDQYPWELLVTEPPGQEYQFYEIPRGDMRAIFIAHIQRCVKKEYREVEVEDFTVS